MGSPNEPNVIYSSQIISGSADQMNLAICSKSQESVSRLFSHKKDIRKRNFGDVFYQENNFRWCGPVEEIVSNEDIPNLSISIHSHIAGMGQNQTVAVYNGSGELARMTLGPEKVSELVVLRPMREGQRLQLCLAEVVRPSWTGSADDRFLSFFVTM
jgi:hypothetical protein